MHIQNFQIDTYSIFVSAIMVLALVLTYLRISRAKSQKIERVEKRKNFEAVPTETPVKKPREEALERGIENIQTRYSYITRISLPLLVIIWILFLAIPHIGKVPKMYASIIVGTLTVLAGIAAKPMIENMFAGLVISFGRTIRIGDTVLIDGYYGTVEEISLTYTVMKVWDWRRYVIPNSRLIQKEFINLSLNDKYVWAHIPFYVDYNSNIEKVEELAIKAVKDTSVFNNEHESPSFWVMDMEEKGIQCWIAGWADSPTKAWDLKHETRRNLIKFFKEEGIKAHFININTAPSS